MAVAVAEAEPLHATDNKTQVNRFAPPVPESHQHASPLPCTSGKTASVTRPHPRWWSHDDDVEGVEKRSGHNSPLLDRYVRHQRQALEDYAGFLRRYCTKVIRADDGSPRSGLSGARDERKCQRERSCVGTTANPQNAPSAEAGPGQERIERLVHREHVLLCERDRPHQLLQPADAHAARVSNTCSLCELGEEASGFDGSGDPLDG